MAQANKSSIKAGGTRGGAIIAKAERVGTNMREAFLNINVQSSALDIGKDYVKTTDAANKIVDAILTSAKQNAGNNVVGRGWTANLSPRTVRALTEQGVFG